MYKLKLNKGLSYTGIVSATKEKPFVTVPDKVTADQAVATGFFTLVEAASKVPAPVLAENTAPGNEGPENKIEGGENAVPEGAEKQLSEKTVPELKQYAAEHGITLPGCTTKSAILQKIEEFEADASAAAEILGQ